MSYRTSGINPEKVTLVFIHGLSGSLSAWYPYEESLGKDFNIVTMDIRGHGKSEHPDVFEGYGPGASADDIYALITMLGAKNIVVISHSFGTVIALELLRSYSDIAIGAIFLSAVYGLQRRPLSMLLRRGSAMFAGLLSNLHMRTLGSRTDYSRYTPASDWDLRRIVADVRHTGLRSYIFSFRHIAMKDRDAEWAELHLPILLIHGTRDSYIPVRFAEELQKKLPHAKLHLIEGGNHILPLNHVAEIESCIREFAGGLRV